MKIIDIINGPIPSLSFEVFPPKTSDKYESVSRAVAEIAKLSPSYMSVTYGAGGGTSDYTARIAQEVSAYGVTSLAHLSCISSTKEQVSSQLDCLKRLGIENILALRGDIPKDFNKSELEFKYAYELVDQIKNAGDFCIGGACYPETHPESENAEKDLEYLKIKVDHGCNFLTTQMFFDNDIFYLFIEKATKKGISVPIVAGIMPITAYSQIERMVMISGNELPRNFMDLISKYQNDPVSLRKVGIEYATNQARNIYENGFNAVHIYSMNKYDVAKEIQDNLKDLIK
jgi:methylenetetrahydrofolate reductase (NADPH)